MTDHVGTALTGGTVLLVVALVVVLTVIVPAARHRSSGSALHRPAA
nr:hypothetical protein [Rhodococcus wratislaviensis]